MTRCRLAPTAKGPSTAKPGDGPATAGTGSNVGGIVMVYRAGLPSPETGVYRCGNCGHEVAVAMRDKFPPCRCGEADWDVRRGEDKAERAERPRERRVRP